jgi:AAA domain, putative AbiEii toxin, Type IV TA system
MSTTVEEIEKTEISQDKKDELLLDSLEIKGYRCFEHLTIEKLGRVNLIVGKNNVGKTALLEALWIYANHDDSNVLHKIVSDRNEITNEKTMSHESLREYNFALKNLFTNRPSIPNKDHDKKESLFFVVSSGGERLEFIEDKIFNSQNDITRGNPLVFEEAFFNAAGIKTTFVLYFYSSSFGMPQTVYYPRMERNIRNVFVSSEGLQNNKLVEFWDTITLTPLEDEVIKAFNLITPNKIIRIDFIGNPNGSPNRVPIARVNGEKERVPLKSFGEGMTRILGLSLALVQCQDGMIFIDEIENGLHYSALLDVWRFIFRTAKDLNIQVFATTHSKDCYESFAAVADESPEEGVFIRLERQGEKIVARIIEEERLIDAVNFNVEVR